MKTVDALIGHKHLKFVLTWMQEQKTLPVIIVLTKCDRAAEALHTDDICFLLGLENLRTAGLKLHIARVTSTTPGGYDPLVKGLKACV